MLEPLIRDFWGGYFEQDGQPETFGYSTIDGLKPISRASMWGSGVKALCVSARREDDGDDHVPHDVLWRAVQMSLPPAAKSRYRLSGTWHFARGEISERCKSSQTVRVSRAAFAQWYSRTTALPEKPEFTEVWPGPSVRFGDPTDDWMRAADLFDTLAARGIGDPVGAVMPLAALRRIACMAGQRCGRFGPMGSDRDAAIHPWHDAPSLRKADEKRRAARAVRGAEERPHWASLVLH